MILLAMPRWQPPPGHSTELRSAEPLAGFAHRVDRHHGTLDRHHVEPRGPCGGLRRPRSRWIFRSPRPARDPIAGGRRRPTPCGSAPAALSSDRCGATSCPSSRACRRTMAMTSAGVLVSAAPSASFARKACSAQATKQRWNACASSVAKISPRWSCAGVPSR